MKVINKNYNKISLLEKILKDIDTCNTKTFNQKIVELQQLEIANHLHRKFPNDNRSTKEFINIIKEELYNGKVQNK